MKTNTRRFVSWVAAITLLLTCAISGLVLPAAAEEPSFKLSHETLHLATAYSTSYPTYAWLDVLNADDTVNTEGITWNSSNTTAVDFETKANGGARLKALKAGTAIITATRENGDSATCEVTVDPYGERVSGGDFEAENLYTVSSNCWSSMVGTGKGAVIEYPAGSGNHVLSVLNNGTKSAFYYQGMNREYSTKYALSFDISGDEGGVLSLYISSSHVKIVDSNFTRTANTGWQELSVTPGATRHIEMVIETTASSNRNYTFGWDNATTKNVYVDNVSMHKLDTATSIALPATKTMMVGDEETLELTTTPVGAYVAGLTFTSSDPEVATVDATGKVTALKAGKATITASGTGLTSATCEVTVTELVPDDIKLSKGMLTLTLGGDSETLEVIALPKEVTIGADSWKSSNESVITVVDGTVTAVGHGTATVTAYSGELSATCEVTVSDEVVIGGTFDDDDTKGVGTFAKVTTNNPTYSWYIAPGEGYGGGNALAIDYRKTSDARWFNWPTFQPNTTYAITFMAKGPAVQLKLLWFDGSAGGWTSSNVGSTLVTTIPYEDDWTQYRVEFTTGSEGFGEKVTAEANYRGFHFNRAANLDTSAVTYIDNFSIKVTDRSDDRILGGDFDVPGAAQLKDNTSAGYVVEDDGSGNKALFIDPGKKEAVYFQALNLKAGQAYELSFKAKGDRVDLRINGERVTGTTGWQTTNASDGYVQYTYNFTTKADAEALTYIFGFGREYTSSGTNGTYIDDLHLLEANNDLVAEEVVVIGDDGKIEAGKYTLTFAARVTNVGDVAFDTPFTVDFRVNGKKIGNSVTYKGTIEPHATAVVVSDEWVAEQGDLSVSVLIDPKYEIVDANRSNNSVACELDIETDDTLEIPEIAQNAGFDTLTFSDEFDSTDTIDLDGTGAVGYKWYVNRYNHMPSVTANELSVENGVLKLMLKNLDTNYGLSTIDFKTGNGFTFNKGYLEMRIKVNSQHAGSDDLLVPAIWSLSKEKIQSSPKTWVEMDWLEYYGDNRTHVTLYDEELKDDGSEVEYKNEKYPYGLEGDAYHVMGWLWEDGKITTYLDGVEKATHSYNADTVVVGTQTNTDDTTKTVSKSGAFTAMDETLMALILSGTDDDPLYVDYVRIWQDVDPVVDDTVALLADPTTQGGEVTLGGCEGNEVVLKDGEDILDKYKKDNVVTVYAEPAEGYVMKPGSLRYVKGNGQEVKILNENLQKFEFDGDSGYKFEFVMPNESVKIKADFVSIEETKNNFAVDTIATGLRQVGENEYDGIRFLTRMHLATKFDPENYQLYVTFGDVEYEVVELGSVLNRDETVGNDDLTGWNWRAVAYQKGGDMKLVDYTDSYIDFTVVMLKGANVDPDDFNNRTYTACGYVILEGKDGKRQTILCESKLTNSINGALAAAGPQLK